MDISVIIPVCDEEESLEELASRIYRTLSGEGREFELIFVNNGAGAGDCRRLYGLIGSYKGVSVLEAAERGSQSGALLQGFRKASGKYIVTIDADLQNAPEDIPALLAALSGGSDLVCGWRSKRRDHPFRKAVSRAANSLYAVLTGRRLKDYNCGLNALTSSLAVKLLAYGRRARFIKQGLVILADSPAEVEVSHDARKSGRSKYTAGVILRSGLDFLFHFRASDFRRRV